jgi:site-specific DNA-cytosine methylase
MKILIACEFSGIVREAFRKQGHEAFSCDILPPDDKKHHLHIKGDVIKILDNKWDMIIAFPPCTHLSVSGARWFSQKRKDGRQQQGIDFFMRFVNSICDKVAIENPIGIMSTLYRKPDQIIQPWQYGHGETKATCLWLKNIPELKPTNIVKGRQARIHYMPPSPDRGKERSRTYQGIADAMAEQWG